MEDQNQELKTSFRPFLIWAIIIFFIWTLSYPVLSSFFSGNEEQGTFGDSFGAINSLFSGLALAGIIYTILLQRKELQLQRLELKETRNELKRSADAQESSQDALNKQINAMLLSAKLSALNTLVENYSHSEQASKSFMDINAHKSESNKEHYLREIESIIESINRNNLNS